MCRYHANGIHLQGYSRTIVLSEYGTVYEYQLMFLCFLE